MSSVDPQRTPLMSAAANGDLDAIRDLVVFDADINEVDADGDNAIGYALYFADAALDTVRLLLELGCAIDHQNNEGWTALNLACDQTKWDVVTLLIENGANIGIAGSDGTTPIQQIIELDAVTILNLLLLRGQIRPEENETLLIKAAQNGSIMCIGSLLSKGTNPNCRSRALRTPLMFAVEQGSAGCVDLLLKFGADPYAVDVDGWDSFMWFGQCEEPDAMIWAALLDKACTWRRRPDGAWERVSGVYTDWRQGPRDLRMMLADSSTKIQKVWRGWNSRIKNPTAYHTPCSSTGT